MIGQTNNQLLAQTEQQISAKIKPQMQQAFAMANHAAATLLYSAPMQHRLMSQLGSTQNPINNAALGAANLTGVLINQSKGKMPVEIAVPVATILMCEILDMIEKSRSFPISPSELAQGTHLMGNYVLKMLGVSQNQAHQVLAHGMSMAHQNMQGQAGQPASPAQPDPAAPPAQASGGIIGSAMQGAQ